MPAPSFTAEDFVAAMQSLLPSGRAWAREPDSNLFKLLLGLALIYEAQTRRDNFLLIDAFPATATELLAEWELTLGLPDPCRGPSPTLEQRRDSVVQKLTALGGQSVPYFIAVAARLGYTITITEYSPFDVGDDVSDPIYGADWAHTWTVNAPAVTVEDFDVSSGVSEALRSWGNELLECVLGELKPTHTVLQFSYS